MESLCGKYSVCLARHKSMIMVPLIGFLSLFIVVLINSHGLNLAGCSKPSCLHEADVALTYFLLITDRCCQAPPR